MRLDPELENVLSLLLAGGKTTKEMMFALAISQPTLSRRLQKLGPKVLQVGHARQARYFAVKALDGHQNWPVYKVSPAGEPALLGQLFLLYPQYYLLQTPEQQYLYDDLPWFIQDMRPRGFIGRALAKQCWQALELTSAEPELWQAEDVLKALVLIPHDAVGNLLIGHDSYHRWLTLQPQSCQMTELPTKASLADQGEIGPSSAAGEQPKFTAGIDERHYLVKYSAALTAESNPVAQRWADLLCAEAAALTLLASWGVPSAKCQIVQSEQRTFLLSERFDREGLFARYGLVSLMAVDAEFIGKANLSWPLLANELVDLGLLSDADRQLVHRIWCFGQLIGNSDMHNGNLSFFWLDDSLERPELQLAPCYDMLPMCFAPARSGVIKQDAWLPNLKLDVAGVHWRAAYQMAEQYWQQLSAEPSCSEGFRLLMQQNFVQLRQVKDSLWRML
ncbi:type II toxin-antitoxin system HipA family toxinoxin YjjJ [Rheinheimera riviphila]|uniref:Type II toxin-antitoxin system HipA family toxinoxin YjjJ n=1 Tax=Rheinheimera riviphila TaxID=1834037 RepID=A0A437QZK0_9GAMM|nr:type II toxin-antitoxin system HipA family toxin YjjJ [Rheinheimera riviphila]RVU39954.1 type II toxin-antitoxin system HipA family toxinoxin YjjJ [Rheinheimera riviphila]